MDNKTIDQQTLQGNASNGMSFPDQMNNGEKFHNLKTKIMNKNVFFIVIAICLNLCLLTGCQQEFIAPDEFQLESNTTVSGGKLTQEQAMKEILPVVQEFLNAQYDYIIGKDKTPRWNTYFLSGSTLLQKQIDAYKNYEFVNSNATFPTYSSEIFYDELGTDTWGIGRKSTISYADDIWTISNLVEHYSLTKFMAGALSEDANGVLTPDPFVKTSGGIIHTLQLKKEGSVWKIVQWDTSGTPGPSRWFDPTENVKKNLLEQPEANSFLEKSFTSKVTATSYNRTNAVNYAIAHVKNPDSRYPDYTNYGGDCTNFVSQCLEAGGWTQTAKTKGRGSVLSWYHDKDYKSPPVLESDVIQLSNKASRIHHSMIVTKKNIVNKIQHVYVSYRNGGSYSPERDVDVILFTDKKLPIKIADSYGLV